MKIKKRLAIQKKLSEFDVFFHFDDELNSFIINRCEAENFKKLTNWIYKPKSDKHLNDIKIDDMGDFEINILK